MTPSQIEKAQDLARECIKKNYKGWVPKNHSLLLASTTALNGGASRPMPFQL